MKQSTYLILFALLFGLSFSTSAQKDIAKQQKRKTSIKDTLDGAFDISDFLLEPRGFMAVPFVITEQSTGYGGGATLLTFHKKKKKYNSYVPPSISGVIGFATENKTWGLGVFHFHVWGEDKVRYMGAVGKPYVNINYYGKNKGFLSTNPVEYNLDGIGTYHRVLVRLNNTNFFVGGSYVFYTTKAKFNEFTDRDLINELLNNLEGKSTLSIIRPMINWDSRNNIFTPTKGLYIGATLSYNAEWLGADKEYFNISPYVYGYIPITDKINSGYRIDSSFTIGDSPFYALPSVIMRGVPAMKYQNKKVMLAETEWNFSLINRWSLTAFTGAGKAFSEFDSFGEETWAYSYGGGFRYKIARKFGIDAGMDFAWSNGNDFAFSFVFGSSWMR